MEKFTQKWAIVSHLEEVEEGSEFYFTDFPLHVTLAGIFAIDKDKKQLLDELTDLLRNQPKVAIEAKKEDFFGPNKDIPVIRVKKSAPLVELHNRIYSWLVGSGARFNSPQYQGKGYLPHSTIQKGTSLSLGERRALDSVSLIDLFPNGDGYKRKIVKTIYLT